MARTLAFASLLAAMPLLVSLTVAAQEQLLDQEAASVVPLQIAILDVDRVFQEAAVVTAARDHIRSALDAYRAETQVEEEEIRAIQRELEGRREELSEDAYEQQRRKLERRLLRAQAVVQERKRSLDQTHLQVMGRVQGALNRIVADIANERSLALILRKDLTVISARSLEITDEVLVRLNEVLPDFETVQTLSDSDADEAPY